MAKICKTCRGSLTIKQVAMNSNVCSECARVSSFRLGRSSTRVANSKNHISLNFEALVAAELKK
jgi:hypothetical protein